MGWFGNLIQSIKDKDKVPPSRLPGRNDACWCGSGRKYKKCHLSKDKRYFKEHPVEKTKPVKTTTCQKGFG